MKCIYDNGKKSAKAMRNVAKTCKTMVDCKSGVHCTDQCVIDLLEKNTEVMFRVLHHVANMERVAKDKCGEHYKGTLIYDFAQKVSTELKDGLRICDEPKTLDEIRSRVDKEMGKADGKKKPAKAKKPVRKATRKAK